MVRDLGIDLRAASKTIDATFRQARDKVRRYSSKDALAVDMESAALVTVAMHRSVELGMVHVVTSELYGEKWVMYSDDNKMVEVERSVIQVLIGILAGV